MLQSSINSPESEKTPQSFDIRPAAVQRWVADLPLADVTKTCDLVFNALAETNPHSLAAPQRFKLLEEMREPVHYLDDALSRHLANAALPLASPAAQIAARLYGLQIEIAKGYRIIVEGLMGLEGLRQDFNLLAAAVQRALTYYARAMLTDYRTYRPAAPALWRTVHALYGGAERKGVAKSLVKDPHCIPDGVSAVETEYKQILLLALADPLRLAQTDMERLARLLGPWAMHCRLSPLDRLAVAEEACLVDLDSDRPPRHGSRAEGIPGPNCRRLDAADLVSYLSRAPERLEEPIPRGMPAERPWQGLIRHVQKSWGTVSKRTFTRNEGKLEEMRWVAGLSGSHRLLSGEDGGSAEVPVFVHPAPRAAQRRHGVREGEVNVAMILNEGANGACLRWIDASPGRIRVDEVVVLGHGRQTAWSVGVVRWLKALRDRGLEFGVELLAPAVIPVMVRGLGEDEGGREALKSLYLPPVEALRQPASLLLPISFFRTDDVISLQTGRQSRPVRLHDAMESNRVYTRFLFTTASEVPPGPTM